MLGSGKRTTGALRSDKAIAVPVLGTALLLIDVINHLDFEGSHVLVAPGRADGAPPVGVALRQIESVLKGHVAVSPG